MIDYFHFRELKRYEDTLKNNYFYSLFEKKQDLINKYKFKSDVLDCQVPQLLKSINNDYFEFEKRDLLFDFSNRDWLVEQFGGCKVLEAYRLNESFKRRIRRLKNKIKGIFENKEGRVYFLTFTFRNDILNTTDDFTRRRYVQRWLNKYTLDYVGNIDFGEEKGREHYHALVVSDYIDSSSWFKKCGTLEYEIGKYDKDSTTKLSNYINKLVNHAIKETTKRQHIIYKREKRSITHESNL